MPFERSEIPFEFTLVPSERSETPFEFKLVPSDASEGHCGFTKPVSDTSESHCGFTKPVSDTSEGHCGFTKPVSDTSEGHCGFPKPVFDTSEGHCGFTKPISDTSEGCWRFAKSMSQRWGCLFLTTCPPGGSALRVGRAYSRAGWTPDDPLAPARQEPRPTTPLCDVAMAGTADRSAETQSGVALRFPPHSKKLALILSALGSTLVRAAVAKPPGGRTDLSRG